MNYRVFLLFKKGIMIVVHQVYNKCTPPLHMGWAPHTVGPTPCERVVYTCCTLGVQESLPLRKWESFVRISVLFFSYNCLAKDYAYRTGH